MIFEEFQEEALAARNAIEAAWVCDDENAHEAAVRCRLRAVERLRESEGDGDSSFFMYPRPWPGPRSAFAVMATIRSAHWSPISSGSVRGRDLR